MKYFLILLLSFSISTYAHDEQWDDTLSEVTQEIDNICGDTWCEGEYNWGFDDLKCNFDEKYCEMKLTLKDSLYLVDSESENSNTMRVYETLKRNLPDSEFETYNEEVDFTFTKTCKMKGFTKKEDVANDNSYSEKLYEAVSDCITDIEDFYAKEYNLASVQAQLSFCPNIKVKNSSLEYNKNAKKLKYRYFYDELSSWMDLVSYADSLGDISNHGPTKLQFLVNRNSGDKDCLSAIQNLRNEYFILGLNFSRQTYQASRIEKAFLFTRKGSNERIKVALTFYSN